MKTVLKSARLHFRLFGIRGVLGRALTSIRKTDREFRAAIPGYSRTILIRLGTTDVAAFEHVFIEREYDLNLPNRPRTIIDAGANVGMSAVYFALRFPTAKILAIEPDPENFEILKQNAAQFGHVTPINAALWNRDGTVSIQDFGGGHWGRRVADSGVIPSITMQTLFREYRIERVDLLKIDVEGAECELFQDHERWINRVDFICVELHDRFRTGCSEAFQLATAEFSTRWRQGELHCVSRYGSISPA